MIASGKEKIKCLEKQEGFATIFVAAQDALHRTLMTSLEADGYLVLHATNELEALNVVISHSRPIHVSLVDVKMNGYQLARALKPYRPDMRVLLVSMHVQPSSETLDVSTALSTVRLIVPPPKEVAVNQGRNGLIGSNGVVRPLCKGPFAPIVRTCESTLSA